ncbi:four helix bundle protein [Capnocytophaga gingivalis]|jgi:TIGR02436 family protein|uniref:four helix bundle protein n=1 Tax=Capnocytophaga gingivalis TaxID=1017 RepID=UPI00403DF368
MKESILKSKSFALAVRIVRLYKYLSEQKTEYILSKQVLRSGTSVGAMVCEAEYSESKADFDHKMGIARKELNETLYWLELLLQTEYNSLSADAIESIKILTTSIKTAKNINN